MHYLIILIISLVVFCGSSLKGQVNKSQKDSTEQALSLKPEHVEENAIVPKVVFIYVTRMLAELTTSVEQDSNLVATDNVIMKLKNSAWKEHYPGLFISFYGLALNIQEVIKAKNTDHFSKERFSKAVWSFGLQFTLVKLHMKYLRKKADGRKFYKKPPNPKKQINKEDC